MKQTIKLKYSNPFIKYRQKIEKATGVIHKTFAEIIMPHIRELVKKKALEILFALNKLPDRYGALWTETSIIGVFLSWLVIEFCYKWPTVNAQWFTDGTKMAYTRLGYGNIYDAIFHMLDHVYPILEMTISAIGILSFCFVAVRFIHNKATSSFIQDLNKLTIIEREMEINCELKDDCEDCEYYIKAGD